MDATIVTAYFNPAKYLSRERNYWRFIKEFKCRSLPLVTIECVFEDQEFSLTGDAIARRRTQSILWQKERLLNSVVCELDAACKKIAWVDADIIFEHAHWYDDMCRLLEDTAVVQLFDSVAYLPKGCDTYLGQSTPILSFGRMQQQSSGCERTDGFLCQGHPGFAWAARREVFDECGLFDLCLAGTADHLMAHGFVGDVASDCVDRMVGLGTPLHREFVTWAGKAFRVTGGRVGYVPGRILHLWHGELKDRKYREYCQELKAFDFVPSRDLELTQDGCWKWTGANPALEDWARDMFRARMDDGDEGPRNSAVDHLGQHQ